MKVVTLPTQPTKSGRVPQPPNGPYDPEWYVDRPQHEREIQGCIEYPGRPVVIYGPQGAGKRTLLGRVLDLAAPKQPGGIAPRVLRIHLRSFSEAQLGSLEALPPEPGTVASAEVVGAAADDVALPVRRDGDPLVRWEEDRLRDRDAADRDPAGIGKEADESALWPGDLDFRLASEPRVSFRSPQRERLATNQLAITRNYSSIAVQG